MKHFVRFEFVIGNDGGINENMIREGTVLWHHGGNLSVVCAKAMAYLVCERGVNYVLFPSFIDEIESKRKYLREVKEEYDIVDLDHIVKALENPV